MRVGSLRGTSGEEAMEVISKNKVDLVVSDVRMPNGDGVFLLNEIKKSNVFMPVVMLVTGFSDLTLDEAYELGADAVFAKPYDREMLHACVARALRPLEEKFQRAHPRIETDIKANFSYDKLPISVEGRVLNIGRGGVFADVDAPFPMVGDEVQFAFAGKISQGKTITGTGIVRWMRDQAEGLYPKGFGIEITYLDEISRDLFVKEVISTSSKSFIPRK